ncbi:MAG: DUF362 domain-containing protein [Oscillospiraceae bacterium]
MSKVYYYNVNDYNGKELALAVEAIFAQSENAKGLCKDTKLLIKPNLLAKHTPDAAVTTHPQLLLEVIRAAKRRGVTQIIMADSSGGTYNAAMMQSIYKASGLASVCQDEGVQIYTQCKWGSVKTNGNAVREFNLIEPVLDADFIINLPKLKTHMMMGMSGAVKNLFGCIPGLQKAEMHMRFPQAERFGEMLVDLCEAVRPQLSIVDGVMGMEGDGPAGGKPRKCNCILGGENPYAIDLAICKLIGMEAMSVPFLSAANIRGLCGKSAEEIEIIGDKLLPIKGFLLPSGHSEVDFRQSVPRVLRFAVPMVQGFVAPRPFIRKKLCIGCGKCADICPGHTINIINKKASIERKNCIRCFCCHEMCPVKAIGVRSFF